MLAAVLRAGMYFYSTESGTSFGYALKSALNCATIRQSPSMEVDVHAASKAGFEGFEFRWDHVSEALKTHSPVELKRVLASAGITPVNVSLFGVRVLGSESEFREGLRNAAEVYSAINSIGCTKSQTSIPLKKWAGVTSSDEDALDLFVERIGALCDLAGKYGITVPVEFLGFGDLANNLRACLSVIKRVSAANVGVILDSTHWYISGGTAQDIESIPRNKLSVVHINDVPDEPMEALRDSSRNEEWKVVKSDAMRVLPGDGVIDLRGFMGSVKRLGYDGFVSVEVFNIELWKQDPFEVARKAKAAYERTIAGIDDR